MSPQSAEHTLVEHPLIRELQAMGWAYLQEAEEDKVADPSFTERERFQDVLLLDRLREALVRINLGADGHPWLDDGRVSQIVGRLQHLHCFSLIESNQAATEMLVAGTTVEGPDGKHVAVRYVDYDHPERNDYLVVNPFRVDPYGSTGERGYIIPTGCEMISSRRPSESCTACCVLRWVAGRRCARRCRSTTCSMRRAGTMVRTWATGTGWRASTWISCCATPDRCVPCSRSSATRSRSWAQERAGGAVWGMPPSLQEILDWTQTYLL